MRCITMREQMSSQGLQSHVGRCKGCLPASLPASLSLHKKTSCTRLLIVYIFLTLLEPSRAPGWCTVYSVTVVRRGLRQLQDQHRLCSLWLINDWPWSSRVMGEGTMAPCAVPSFSAEDAKKSLSVLQKVCTQQCPSRSLTLAKRNDKLECSVHMVS